MYVAMFVSVLRPSGLKYMEVELENGFVSLGLATERIEIWVLSQISSKCLVSVLRPSGLKYIKSDKEELEDMSRSCDRVD